MVVAAAQRRVAMKRKHVMKNQRYLLRFIEDDKYMVADRHLIVAGDTEDVPVGCVKKVTYDRVCNLTADAIILFVGEDITAKRIESLLLKHDPSEEQDVLSGAMLDDDNIVNEVVGRKRRQAAEKHAEKPEGAQKEHSLPKRRALSKTPDVEVHLSVGEAPAGDDLGINEQQPPPSPSFGERLAAQCKH